MQQFVIILLYSFFPLKICILNTIIKKHPKQVLELLINEKRRGDWDLFYQDGGLIEKLSETEGYVYYQTKAQGWTVWPRDFVMAISARISDSSDIDGEHEAKFVGTSIELEEKPAISSHVRGTVILGGYHLKPIKVEDQIHTQVTYIFNIDAAGWIPHRFVIFEWRNLPFFFKTTHY